MEASPPGASSSSGGESIHSEHICESRTNQLVSPSPHSYDHHGNGHLSVSPQTPHQVASRYVSALASCMDGAGPYTPEQIYNQNIHDSLGLALPQIKYESPFIHNFHREAGDILKNLENIGEGPHQRMTIGKSSLSLTQVECICEAMLQRKDVQHLEDFLKSIPPRLHIGSEPVYRARIHVLFHRGNYTEMYKLMECFNYSPKYHTELQELWYQAHYKEQENARGRHLGAVDKYRIRNKFILPKSIWDGEKTTYCFKDRAREALKDCYGRCRYPTPSEKKALSEMTGLTSIQVSNWFKNKRQRDRTPQQNRDGNEMDLSGSLGLGPQSGGHGKGGDDSSNDMKPLVSFRSHKKIKLNKPPFFEGRMNMRDVGLPITLTRKETMSSSSPVYPSLPNVTITPRTAHHIPGGNGHHSHQSELPPCQTPGGSNGISVIQSINGTQSQFYSQGTSYEAILQSPHHYSNHANSPHILSYG